MTPKDYLLFSIKHRNYASVAWIISVFTVTNESEEKKAQGYIGKFIREPFGFFYLDENLEKQQLDTKQDLTEPLFRKSDVIRLTKQELPFIGEEVIETTLGRVLLNLLVVLEPFQGKLKFINKPFKPGMIESMIAPILRDNPPEGKSKEPNVIYIDDYLAFCKASILCESLSPIFCNSITKAGLLPAPGRREYREKLLKEFEGKLNNPVEMAKFQDLLKAYDVEYLKANDPSYGKFMDGKVVDSRNKTYMTQGGESNEFIGQLDTTPIIKSLDEGIDLEPEAFVAAVNTIRYGSYARGAETVNGGVVSKALQTALDTWRIVDGDCGTKFGIELFYDEKSIKELIGRYIVVSGKPVLIENEEQAKPFINKTVLVRSPAYCGRAGTETCVICAGKALSIYPQGQVIPAMEVSAGIMSDSLKKMHATALSSKPMDIQKVIS